MFCVISVDDDDDDDVDTDAPHPKQQNDSPSLKSNYNEVVPKFCDVLLCHAVVPGYVALRDRKSGRFVFCLFCIMKPKNMIIHFLEIFQALSFSKELRGFF